MKTKTFRKKRPLKKFIFRKKVCIFCSKDTPAQEIDYKDVVKLSKFISERGKIMPRRHSGLCARHQRKLSSAIKRARFIAFLPFVRK